MGSSQNYASFLGTLNILCHIFIGYPRRNHNFDNRPCVAQVGAAKMGFYIIGSAVPAASVRIKHRDWVLGLGDWGSGFGVLG